MNQIDIMFLEHNIHCLGIPSKGYDIPTRGFEMAADIEGIPFDTSPTVVADYMDESRRAEGELEIKV